MNVAITGANRGIGLEFVRQLLARGDRVLAGARAPAGATALRALEPESKGRLRISACDVADEESVQAWARGAEGAVDLLINNAGVKGKWVSLEEMDFADASRTHDINALGALRVTRALLPALRRGQARRVVSISSKMGSIADNSSGGAYAYRMSKAALNMGARSMAVDLREEGFTVAVLNPGWVQTDMGGHDAPTPVAESVRGMLRVIDGLRPEQTGGFFDYLGEPIPW